MLCLRQTAATWVPGTSASRRIAMICSSVCRFFICLSPTKNYHRNSRSNGYTFRTQVKATARRIPVAHFWPGTAERGALFSLEADVQDNFRRAAGCVDRALNGAKPANLAIYQPTRYEFVVKAKTAQSLGIALPQALLLRADRVIE
ncbi:MAG: ABC transporter substrate binding protein [Burkholderiales bacterium]